MEFEEVDVKYEVFDKYHEPSDTEIVEAFRNRRARTRGFAKRCLRVVPLMVPVIAILILLVLKSWLLAFGFAIAGLLFFFWCKEQGEPWRLGMELHSPHFEPNMSETAKLAEKCGLVVPFHAPSVKTPAYLKIVDEDPELACAGLRIEIERRIKRLAVAHGIESTELASMISDLGTKGVFDREQLRTLNLLRRRLNSAVHGNAVEIGTNHCLRDLGPRLVAKLDQLIDEYLRKQGSKKG